MVNTQSGATAGYGRAPHPISLKQSVAPTLTSMGAAVSPPVTNGDYWKMPSPQVQNEILKHEAQQSKVTMTTKCKVCVNGY